MKFLVVLGLSTSSIAAGIEAHEEAVIRAATAWSQGQPQAAYEALSAIANENPTNADVLIALGEAAVAAEHLSEGMAAYLAARALKPRDADLEVGINDALNRVGIESGAARSAPSGLTTVLAPLGVISAKECAIATVLLLVGGGLGFSLGIYRRWSRTTVLTSTCAALISLGVFLAKRLADETWAAAKGPESAVRSGPDAQDPKLFDLREGFPVKVDGARGDAKRIVLSDGRKGWIQNGDLLQFSPKK